MAKRVVLHYGGQKFDLPVEQAGVLRKLEPHDAGVLRINLFDGRWLSFVYGPGIPILLEETDTPQTERERRATIL